MVDEHPQAAKESKRIGKLKKFFNIGQSSLPQPSASNPVGRDISSAPVSSVNASLSTHQQHSL